ARRREGRGNNLTEERMANLLSSGSSGPTVAPGLGSVHPAWRRWRCWTLDVVLSPAPCSRRPDRELATFRNHLIEVLMKKSLAVVLAFWCVPAAAEVLHFADLTSRQTGKLDRARTVLIVPGGILEEHGPYLPNGADGIFNQRLANDLADAI